MELFNVYGNYTWYFDISLHVIFVFALTLVHFVMFLCIFRQIYSRSLDSWGVYMSYMLCFPIGYVWLFWFLSKYQLKILHQELSSQDYRTSVWTKAIVCREGSSAFPQHHFSNLKCPRECFFAFWGCVYLSYQHMSRPHRGYMENITCIFVFTFSVPAGLCPQTLFLWFTNSFVLHFCSTFLPLWNSGQNTWNHQILYPFQTLTRTSKAVTSVPSNHWILKPYLTFIHYRPVGISCIPPC